MEPLVDLKGQRVIHLHVEEGHHPCGCHLPCSAQLMQFTLGHEDRRREDFRQWCENHIRRTKSIVNHIKQ